MSRNIKKSNIVELKSPEPADAAKESIKQTKKRHHLPRAHFFRGKIRLFGHCIHARFILLAFVEYFTLIGANYLVYRWLSSDFSAQEPFKQLPQIMGISLVFIIFILAMGLYSGRQRESFYGVLISYDCCFVFWGGNISCYFHDLSFNISRERNGCCICSDFFVLLGRITRFLF